MNVARLLALMALFISTCPYGDVLISVEATLIRPSCIITAESGDNELSINFREVAADKLSEEKRSFGIIIKQCDLQKGLQIYLSPKWGDTLMVNNETVLATSIEGLGIRFSEENNTKALNLYQWEKITPTVNGDTGKVTLQSQLVTNQPFENLIAGPFKAALSVMIDYL